MNCHPKKLLIRTNRHALGVGDTAGETATLQSLDIQLCE